ncbi:MAG: AfsR/SARP family transcriptional regulator [Acidimicrobiales bacterium]
MVDTDAVTVHPHGLLLKPYLRENRVAIHKTTNPGRDGAGLRSIVAPSVVRATVPGDLEVKLLTVVPWIAGLNDPIPAKRARRAIELIAYLAVHRPDPVSGDRLRTRVLGSPELDAAAKTLFNTVGAARRALGYDKDGRLYLPNASRRGHYEISDLISVDVSRAVDLIGSAKTTGTVEEALALYRCAFELIVGEPLGGVLSGYSWWRSEGHEARLTTALVGAACKAVRLAIDAQLLELASWVLDRARLVDPYGEVLSRAAMTTAAASGDRPRLRREWDECRRRVSELDADAVPSPESRNLFERLSTDPVASVQASLAAIEDAP